MPCYMLRPCESRVADGTFMITCHLEGKGEGEREEGS
jgi:hypothetical protein